MQPLKAFVILMGVLILMGFGGIIGVIAERLVAAGRAPTGASVFQVGAIALPKGAKVVETIAAGDRLVLRIAKPEGGEALIVYELATGRTLGTVALAESP